MLIPVAIVVAALLAFCLPALVRTVLDDGCGHRPPPARLDGEEDGTW